MINLLVPAGTLFGWSSAPGEIPGYGAVDPEATRDMVQTAAAHPETRWCVTLIDPVTKEAVAHGCAPGQQAAREFLASLAGEGRPDRGRRAAV